MSTEPCTIVIFGATGDLNRRKLAPALFRLRARGLIHARTLLLGYGRRDLDDDTFREHMEDVWQKSRITPDEAGDESGEQPGKETPADDWSEIAPLIHYQRGGYDAEGIAGLAERLRALEAEHDTGGRRVFYLATPPSVIGPVVEGLGAAGLVPRPVEGEPWTRVVIEKPFGRDSDSAVELNRRVTDVLDESQIFRIDHYLGKETVQNILVFRFANGIFEPVWNASHVDHVQITVAESLGVEGRGGYYDGTGVLRDMIQNHVLQLLTLVAMEPPVSLSAGAIRDEKVKVLQALRPISEKQAVRGQYAAGTIDGEPAPGYRHEDGVQTGSATETFAALKVQIDNWRWAGTPFYIRSGKRLSQRLSEIRIVFKSVPRVLFSRTTNESEPGAASPVIQKNVLTLRLQPNEGFWLRVSTKVPGAGDVRIRPVGMDFAYEEYFETRIPDAYERLLHDVIVGDPTLFARGDEVLAAWEFLDPVLRAWQDSDRGLDAYFAGSWGPGEADDLLAEDHRAWRTSFDDDGLVGERCVLPPDRD
jgi:glucose-6-phosphate 1-dehydrogenase